MEQEDGKTNREILFKAREKIMENGWKDII